MLVHEHIYGDFLLIEDLLTSGYIVLLESNINTTLHM